MLYKNERHLKSSIKILIYVHVHVKCTMPYFYQYIRLSYKQNHFNSTSNSLFLAPKLVKNYAGFKRNIHQLRSLSLKAKQILQGYDNEAARSEKNLDERREN